MASAFSCWLGSRAGGGLSLHSLPSEEELGALPGKFWVTCLFLGQSTAARGWDILIGLLGHLVPSWTNHLAQEDTMLSLATHVAVPASGGGGWVGSAQPELPG